MHDHERDGCREAGCKPLESWERIIGKVELEDGRDDDTGQTAEEMAENEGPGLGQRDIDRSIAEDCGGALVAINMES